MIGSVLIWWTVSSILGLFAFPLCWRLFNRLSDRGYGISRILGLLAAGYLLWIGASFGTLKNDLNGALISVAILAIVGFLVAKSNWSAIRSWLKENVSVVLTSEILFLLVFAFWAFVRANTPEIQHTEKPMELAFLNSILRSDAFPPNDPWLSDFAISYYYYGYILLAFLTRVTGVLSSEAFNLGNALWFALTALAAYSVLYNLFAASGKKRLLAPLLGPLFILLAGNLEVIFDLLYHRHAFWSQITDGQSTSAFWVWLGLDDLANPPSTSPTWIPDRYLWWWQASRVIFDVRLNGSTIEMIDEFPFFSFLLADNHPHLLALPFVFLAILLSLNIFLARYSGPFRLGRKINQKVKLPHIIIAFAVFMLIIAGLQILIFINTDLETIDNLINIRDVLFQLGLFSVIGITMVFIALGWVEVALPRMEFWISAWIFGALAFLNISDFPIYLSLLFLIILWNQWEGLSARVLKRIAITYFGLFVMAIIFYLPWYPGFGSQVGGVLPNILFPTRLHQFLIMFAPLFLPLFVWVLKEAKPAIRRVGIRLPTLIAFGIPLGLFVISSLLGLLAYFSISSNPATLDAVLAGLGATGETVQEAVRDLVSNAMLRRLTGSWTALLLGITLSLSISILLAIKLKKGERPYPINQSNIFVVFLIIIGALLVIGPDFLYVRDSFGHRMNTIFKFYYAAWVLWGIAAAYAAVQLWPRRLRAVNLLQLLVFIPVVLSLLYPILSTWTKTNQFAPANGLTLDGIAYMERSRPDEYAAFRWIDENLDDGVILEAVGGSYTSYGRVSTHTGLSTLLGWPYHEFQWRGDFSYQGSREGDIAEIYTTDDWEAARTLIMEYGVDYVFVGSLERSKYQPPEFAPINEEKFSNFMRVVFKKGEVTIYALPENGSQSNLEDEG